MHESEVIDVMKSTRIAALYMLALPVALFAQAPDVRVVQTNQIPENPAKMIEVVNAPEPARNVIAAPVPGSEDVVVRRQRAMIPVPALGAPVVREPVILEDPREPVELGKHGSHK